MDEPGYRARMRDAREERHDRRHHVEHRIAETQPMPEADDLEVPKHAGESTTAYTEPNYRPPAPIEAEHIPGATQAGYGLQGSAENGTPEAAQERVGRKLEPHLQMMAGPMLRYDTVDVKTNVWYGFCMIVTADDGSTYEPTPSLQLRVSSGHSKAGASSHADASEATSGPANGINGGHSDGDANGAPQGGQPNGVNGAHAPSQSAGERVSAQNIYRYHAASGSHTFWRFALTVPLSKSEQAVHYSINHGRENTFYVPAIGQNMRWVGHSCNGFSAGVDTAAFNGPDPLWNEVLDQHQAEPYHCVIGGGDQIYCDPLTKEKEISEWVNMKSVKDKTKAPLTEPMKFAIDRFLFNHYCTWFRSGAFGKTISQIPMLNILDDHDLIDGFGSYPDSLQTSPVFSGIGAHGYRWYLLWQMFIVDEVDGTPPPGKGPGEPATPHSNRSIVFGGEGVYIPFPSHNFVSYLGPEVYILLLDCRAERKKTQVCSQATYGAVFKACEALPATVKHLVILLGVPIAYPRMVFIERMLENKANPALLLAWMGLLPGFKNKFNADAELLDDANDHWCAGPHKKERNWFIQRTQSLAKSRNLRITFLSGDVHCASVGRLFTKGNAVKPEEDYRYMLNVISSAIVNTPPPPALIAMMGRLGGKKHKTLWSAGTDEDMVPVFGEDLEGHKNTNNPRIMGARNFVAVKVKPESGDLEFDLRMELKRGEGKTKSYPVVAPAPNYSTRS